MKTIKLGIYEKALPLNKDIEDVLHSIADAGYSFFEMALDKDRLPRFQWSTEQKATWLRASLNSGVRFYNMVLSVHRDFPFGSKEVEIRQQAMQIMEQAIDFSSSMGIRTIQIAGYYTLEHEVTTDDSKKRFLEGMYRSAELASQAGVMLGIENVDRDIISLEQIKEIVEEVQSPWLKMYPDVGNLTAHHFNVKQSLAENINHIIGIHLKDTKEGVFRRTPFGEGIVDFKAVFETLFEAGYDGPFGLEMWNDNSRNSMEIIKEARTWMLDQMLYKARS
ncbi:L-ribulose-5-phosphate 3-epimerase [Oceanobacillus polygoni]|uniref:Hexulose-6-phosphate isomerase n=1 Tax=Oceanobacillus polygoni TaxID=1235259 RepID=A0A9X0Z009_9BACI|nr:L-ribulose-5-phosphate 3-epimerase [Oceanobacillus polygoni]MBP2079439.1 putative hexulose-6-phosphate isomerase [Oceanobacillus polygoni]